MTHIIHHKTVNALPQNFPDPDLSFKKIQSCAYFVFSVAEFFSSHKYSYLTTYYVSVHNTTLSHLSPLPLPSPPQPSPFLPSPLSHSSPSSLPPLLSPPFLSSPLIQVESSDVKGDDDTDKSVSNMKAVLTSMLDKLQTKIDSTEKVRTYAQYSYNCA